MSISWIEKAKQFKSPLSVVVGFLLRSRETKNAECQRLREQRDELQRELRNANQTTTQQQQEIERLKQQVRSLEIQMQQTQSQTITLPDDPPVGRSGFGSRMITLSVNLARSVGLRGAARVIATFFDWLVVDQKVPHWTTIRTWLMRLGIASVNDSIEPANDWIWLADHSNQIGQEKVLVVLGVRASCLPEPGKTLKHEDLHVLCVQPGTEWKRADMAKVYDDLAKRFGAPRAVLVDGAVELREGAECLKNYRPDTEVFRDFKHYAANVFKSLVGNSERFKEFSSRMGTTRSVIQQTELAHLTPPSPKQKARFMNLASTLNWANMALWVLNTPEAKSRERVTDERLEDKLGWLREFDDDLVVWQECQRIISLSVTFVNKQGLYRGASEALQAVTGSVLPHDTSTTLAHRLIEFVKKSETALSEGERLPLSTEILESSFSLFKQLERQHSKGGFTSLLATFAALLKPATAQAVKTAFRKVSNADVKEWTKKHLGETVTGRRHQAYREYKKATSSATNVLLPT